MHPTSLYGLKLSVLRGVGAKALATDHRDLESRVLSGTVWLGTENVMLYRDLISD